MADQTEDNPASLEEAVPAAERGQGARAQDLRRATGEAAADGVNLNSDRDEPRTAGDGAAAGKGR